MWLVNIKKMPDEFLFSLKGTAVVRLFKTCGWSPIINRFEKWCCENDYCFENYFITLAEWRNKQIDKILEDE